MLLIFLSSTFYSYNQTNVFYSVPMGNGYTESIDFDEDIVTDYFGPRCSGGFDWLSGINCDRF